MKQNDYIVASIKNPDFSPAEFRNIAGLNLENTQILTKDQYTKSKFIRENPLFADSNGSFSEEKFAQFYQQKLKDFQEFAQAGAIDDYQYSPFDTRRRPGDKMQPFGMTLSLVPNPERVSMGIVGPNKIGKRTLSDRELAQREKVFDYERGVFRDYTPNDHALTTNPFKWIAQLWENPLVLATYDENGTHFDPILGREVSHVKGQKKLNANGVPYYETLAGRSMVGKDALSVFDNMTVDGKGINKYDFFDSDGIDKSVPGIISKTIVTYLPMITPLAVPYSGALVLREILKAAPMLYGIGSALFTDNNNLPMLNNLAGIANRFSTSTSDYSKEKTFSFENFGNLVSDVALQWGQQKWIVKSFQKLSKNTEAVIDTAKSKALNQYRKQANALLQDSRAGNIPISRVRSLTGAETKEGFENLIKNGDWERTVYGRAAQEQFLTPAMDKINKYTRIGQDLSLGYMAIISNTDVYQTALEKGATKGEAALMALGSTVGMFSVDKFLGLGEMFFDAADPKYMFRATAREEAGRITKNLAKYGGTKVDTEVTQEAQRKSLGKWFMSGIESGKRVVKLFESKAKERTLGFLGKSVGEGLEEVSEELVTDLTKSLFEIAGQYGWTSQKSYGAWENAGDRYLMSFLGGAVGGGLFYLKDPGIQQKQAAQALHLLIRQGKAQEVRDAIADLHKKGQLGSTQLSYLVDSKVSNKPVFITADNEHESQNDFVFNVLNQSIDQLEEIIQRNRLNKTEDDLFKDLVLSDERYMRLAMELRDNSYVTGYQERYQQLVNRIIDIEQMKAEELSKKDTEVDKRRIDELDEALNNARLERDKFFNGEHSLDYMQKMLFAMHPGLSSGFAPTNVQQYAQAKGWDYNQLSGTAKQKMDQQWEEYRKNPSVKDNLDYAFRIFQNMQYKLLRQNDAGKVPLLDDIDINNYNFWEDIIKKLEDYDPTVIRWDADTRLDTDDDEEYEYRNHPKPDEDPQEFITRRLERQQLIDEHNSHWKEWIRDLTAQSSYMDSNVKRRFLAQMGKTSEQFKKQIISRIVSDKVVLDALNGNPTPDELRTAVRASVDKIIEDKWAEKAGGIVSDDNFYFAELENLYDLFDVMRPMLGDKIDLAAIYDQLEGQDISEKIVELYNTTKRHNEETGEDLSPLETGYSITAEDLPELDLINAYNTYVQKRQELEASEDYISSDETRRKNLLNDLAKDLQFTDWREDYVERKKQEEKDLEYAKRESQVEKIINELTTNEDLKLIENLESKIELEGPAQKIISVVAAALGGEQVDIQKGLETIHKIWVNQENPNDFELSNEQKKYLNDSLQLINFAKALVASTYMEANLADNERYAYNKTINQFVHDHSKAGEEAFKNFEDLYTLDSSTGNSLMLSLEQYEKEINQWLELGKMNSDNKVEALWKTLEGLNAARVDVIKNVIVPNAVDIPYLDELSEGFERVTDRNDLESSFILESLFHNNVQKLLAKGVTTSQILDSLIQAIGDDDALLSGMTSRIDQDLTGASFTKYDQLMYLAALMAVDPIDSLNKELNFINNNSTIAPIATQQPGMLLGMALDTHPEIINETLDKLKDIATVKGLQLPILYNTRIYTGLGGAGKSQVEAKFTIDPKEKTWISGPTEDQVNGLKGIAPSAEGMTVDQILQTILGNNKGKVQTDYKIGTGLDKSKTFVLNDLSSYFITTNAPKHIVIDEATHIDTLTLQALGQYAKLTGAKITLLGDENQKGFNKEVKLNAPLQNIQREVVLAYRTPRLNISLRSGNVWKTYNQKLLTTLMDKLRASNEQNGAAVVKEVMEKLRELSLSFYENNTTLNGDKFVSDLSDEDLTRLQMLEAASLQQNPQAVPIAFIGDVNSATFAKLRSVLKKVKHIDPLNVQGQEFDYIVVDKDFDQITEDDSALKGGHIMPYLQDIYTMITRSRNGSIIIDRGQISKGIQGKYGISNKQEQYTTQSINLSDEAKEAFTESRKQYIETILEKYKKSPKPEEKKVEPKKTEEPKTEELKTEGTGELSLEEVPIPQSFDEEDPALVVLPEDVESINNEIITTTEPEPQPVPTGTPVSYRAYSNIQFLGGATIDDNGRWILTGTRRDIGIFGSRGTVIASNKAEKSEFVRALSALRAIFTFDMDMEDTYNILPHKVRDLFNKKDFTPENVEFYAVAEDYDPNTHNLVGLTTADNDKTSFMEGPDGKKKVISIQARIKSKGDPITITLGAVANPDKWLEYVNKNEEGLTNDELAAKRIEVEEYRIKLQNLVNQGEIKIKRPKFTGKTRLIQVPNSEKNARGLVRNEIRLGALNEGENNEWEDRTANMSVSPVFIITGDIETLNPSLNKERKLKGKPVVFVSANPNLRPEDLYTIWQNQQKDRKNNKPQVRMLVLHNAGVSFNSLYRRTFQEIYRKTGKEDGFSLPVRLRHNAIRMFASLWNFRANLTAFNDEVQNLLNANNWSKEDLVNYAKADEQYYNTAKQELGSQYVNEETYTNWLNNHTSLPLVDKVIKIREFNDSLATKVRQFRIGYSTRSGAYIRKLTNIRNDNPFYDEVDPNGIYLNPELAEQYTNFITNLFDKVVYEFFPGAKKIDIGSQIDYNKVKGWANDLEGQGKVFLGVDNRVIDVTFGPQALVDAFPIALMNIAHNLYRKAALGKQQFLNQYNDQENPTFHIGYALDGQAKYDIDYTELDEAFEYKGKKGLLRNNDPDITGLPGYISFEHSKIDDGEVGYIDQRLDNLFNLIFHGIVAQSSKHYNDFNYKQETSEDAIYKDGMFSDPVIIRKKNYGELFAYSATNPALFLTDALPGGPILEWNFEPIEEVPVVEPIKPGNLKPESPLKEVLGTLQTLGIIADAENFEFGEDIQEDIEEIKTQIENDHKKRIIQSQDIRTIDLKNVVYDINYDGNTVTIIYLTDKYPELKNVTEIKRVKNYLEVSDGNMKWKLSYINGDINKDTIIEPKPEAQVNTESEKPIVSIKPKDIIKDMLRLLDNWKDDENYKEAVNTLTNEINEGYLKKWAIKNNKVPLVVGTESFDKALNNLVKNYPDTDEDAKDLLSRIIEAYKSSCIIIS